MQQTRVEGDEEAENREAAGARAKIKFRGMDDFIKAVKTDLVLHDRFKGKLK